MSYARLVVGQLLCSRKEIDLDLEELSLGGKQSLKVKLSIPNTIMR